MSIRSTNRNRTTMKTIRGGTSEEEISNGSVSSTSSSSSKFVIPAIATNHLASDDLAKQAAIVSGETAAPESYFSPSSHDTSGFSLNVLTGQFGNVGMPPTSIRQQWSEDSLLFSEDEEDVSTVQQSNVNTEHFYNPYYTQGEKMREEDQSIATPEFLEMFSHGRDVVLKRSDDFDSDSEAASSCHDTTQLKIALFRTLNFKLRVAAVAFCLLVATIVPLLIMRKGNDGARPEEQHFIQQLLSSNVTHNKSTIIPSQYYYYNHSVAPSHPLSLSPSSVTASPSNMPSINPTISISPTEFPSISPTYLPSNYPSHIPTQTLNPSISLLPTQPPSYIPSSTPSQYPSSSLLPTLSPSRGNLIPFLTMPKFYNP